jgi:glutamate synthase domain-containing protein 3
MKITVGPEFHFQKLNEAIRESKDKEIEVDGCIGQRYIGAALSDKTITVNGTPGNALGAYLDGAEIYVNGNAQDAVGDTMNGGRIVVRGNGGDAVGYAMRGGKILLQGNAGYRVGIHMKAYKENKPVIVVGGYCGSFLGEYQAGGIIIVLGLTEQGHSIVGNFCGTGMHGGEIYLRTDVLPPLLPKQVKAERVEKIADEKILALIGEYCKEFGSNEKEVLDHVFYRLTPDSANPYKTMYVNN